MASINPNQKKNVKWADDGTAAKRSKIEQTDEPHEEQPQQDNRNSPDFWLIMGPPKRGKSHFMRWMICDGFQSGKWEYLLILSPSKHNGDFAFIQDQDFIWDDPRTFETALANLLNQQKCIANAKGMGAVPRVLFLVDDPLGAINWHKPIWLQLTSCFRQYMIDVVIATQYIAKLPLEFFSFATRGVVFRLDMESDVKRVWERWLGAFETGIKDFKGLQNFMKTNMPIEKRLFLDIDRNPHATNNVKLTKAPPKEAFEKIKIRFD